MRGARPLLSGPGVLSSLDGDGFSIDAHKPGRFLVRVHYTPYWSVLAGTATVAQGDDDWTEVDVRRPGTISVDAEFSLRL